MNFETYRKRGKGWEYLGIQRNAVDSRAAALRAGYIQGIKVVGVRPEGSRDKIYVHRFTYVPEAHHGQSSRNPRRKGKRSKRRNPDYRTPQPVFIDTFGGAVKGTALEVIEPGDGSRFNGKIRVKVNETRGGYRKGEVVILNAHTVVPRKHRRVRSGQYRINTQYAWVK